MDLSKWWKCASAAEKKQLIEASGSTINYLGVMASRNASVGEELAFKLVAASELITPERKMTVEALRPESYLRFKELFMKTTI